MKSKAIKLEIFGLGLVLASFFFQSFFYEPLSSLSNEAVQYKLEKKMDIIFNAYFSSSPDVYSQYTYAENNESLKNVNNQTDWAKVVLSILFAVGSLLIIAGKHLEYTIVKSNEKEIINIRKE